METSLFNRVQATLLALATVALFLLAVLNFRQERAYQQPDDGVWWHEVAGGLQAERVLPHMPGQFAGLQANDLLTAVNDAPVKHISDLERAFYRAGGPYGQVYYTITRDGIPLDTPLRVARDAFERMYFEYLIQKEGGSMTRVADRAGLERTHLYRKLKQLNIRHGRRLDENL